METIVKQRNQTISSSACFPLLSSISGVLKLCCISLQSTPFLQQGRGYLGHNRCWQARVLLPGIFTWKVIFTPFYRPLARVADQSSIRHNITWGLLHLTPNPPIPPPPPCHPPFHPHLFPHPLLSPITSPWPVGGCRLRDLTSTPGQINLKIGTEWRAYRSGKLPGREGPAIVWLTK